MEGNVESYEKTVASELDCLQLDKLETEWIKEVIDNDFLQCQDIPLLYDEILEENRINSRLKHLRKAFLQWLELNKGSSEDSDVSTRQSLGSSSLMPENTSAAVNLTNNGSRFWSFLFQERKVNIHSLLALIGFFIDRGSTLSSSHEERQRCFEAAKMYFTMICIPGSMAFRVFHQMLYMKALQLVHLYVQTRKYQQKSALQSQQARKGQHNNKQTQPIAEFEEEEGEAPIGPEEITAIEKAMSSFLDVLFLVAQHLSFKRYPNILKETIECILPIISLDRGAVSSKALEIVQNFCNPLHGDAVQTVHYVFVHILPYLVLDSSEKDLNNKNFVAFKEISLNLIKSFISKFGETIYPLVHGLIKHVCVEVVDRAEYRQKTAQTALDLLQLIPKEHRQGMNYSFI